MTRALDRLFRNGTPRKEDLASFLSENEFPLVEGRSVTFAFVGHADAVRVQHWIYGLPSAEPLSRIDGTKVWVGRMNLPPGSRVEYKLLLSREGHEELIQDPRNPHLAHDPFGANSVIHADGYTTPEWTQPDPDTNRGTLEEQVFQSKVFGDERKITVYVPARLRLIRQYPLLIVHDGQDFLKFSGLRTVLDNLIQHHEIPSVVAALIQSPNRLPEYGANPNHALFLRNELVPFLEKNYPLEPAPQARCLVGASFGGVACLHAAAQYPGFFGRLLLQSGSFAFTDIGANRHGAPFEPVVRFMNRFRKDPGRPSERVFMSCGQYESLIYENRSLVPLLQDTGMSLRYVESRDGHNWENWRDRLREGLSWLLPGPLWMIYE